MEGGGNSSVAVMEAITINSLNCCTMQYLPFFSFKINHPLHTQKWDKQKHTFCAYFHIGSSQLILGGFLQPNLNVKVAIQPSIQVGWIA